jgi:hypothetical protein
MLCDNGFEGYFASTRLGSLSERGDESALNDIYHFEMKSERAKKDSIKKQVQIGMSAATELDQLAPLVLYFDNDAPEPSSQLETTSLDYETTVRDYIANKAKYELEFSKGLNGAKKEAAINDIDAFFTNSVEGGLNKLEKFAGLMKQCLDGGRSIKLKIKGYTSPLAMDDYNKRIAKRRISSMKNYLLDFNHKAFDEYINGTAANRAKLAFEDEAIGEAASSKKVSDNPNDRRNSVYSRAAALERKIEITDVVIDGRK